MRIAVPLGADVPSVVGANLPHLTGGRNDSYYAYVSRATLTPPDTNMTVVTGSRDQEDMTDMERKVRAHATVGRVPRTVLTACVAPPVRLAGGGTEHAVSPAPGCVGRGAQLPGNVARVV